MKIVETNEARKKNRYGIIPVIVFFLFLSGCNDKEGDYASDAYIVMMATVQKEQGTVYPYFRLDNGETVWVSVPKVPLDGLVPGQRVIGSFTVLQAERDGFDYFVRLNEYAQVSVKPVINLTETNQESIGDDKVALVDLWVGGSYVNVLFRSSFALGRKPEVNLVVNRLIPPIEDGYAHLEFRYNDDEEANSSSVLCLVSFDLGNYAPDQNRYTGVKVKINTVDKGEEWKTIEYANNTGNSKNLTLPDITAAKNME